MLLLDYGSTWGNRPLRDEERSAAPHTIHVVGESGVSRRVLARLAYEQAWVFGATFAFMQQAVGLREVDRRLGVELAHGATVRTRIVPLATGASYRRLGVPALEALTGAGVVYGAAAAEAPTTVGAEVVDGGGEGWLDWLVLRDRRSGQEERVVADELFLMIGALPHTDWLPA